MLNLAIIFPIIAIIDGILGFVSIAGAATSIAWIAFIIGLVLAIIFFFFGRRPTI